MNTKKEERRISHLRNVLAPRNMEVPRSVLLRNAQVVVRCVVETKKEERRRRRVLPRNAQADVRCVVETKKEERRRRVLLRNAQAENDVVVLRNVLPRNVLVLANTKIFRF
jgi:hypothetical protein